MFTDVDVSPIFHRNRGSVALIVVVSMVVLCFLALLCGGCAFLAFMLIDSAGPSLYGLVFRLMG